MRRLVNSRLLAPVLIALGAFLLVAAVLVRAYAYPALARVPANYDSMTYLSGSNVTIFDSNPEVLAPVTTDLSIASHTVAGDFSDAPKDVVVWANSTTVTRADGKVFQQSTELSPFDAVTGAASDYKVGFAAASEGDRTSVVRKGQVYKFPFNTQKRDYLQWDGALGEATPAKYTGTSSIQGLTVYTFVQTIEPTAIDTVEVPGSVFGSDKPSVEATMMYGMVRTLSIEPATGSPVNRVEQRTQYLSYQGKDVAAFEGTVAYTQQSIDDIVAQLKTQAPLLSAARLAMPIGFGLAGLVLLSGGVVLSRRHRALHQVRDDRELMGV